MTELDKRSRPERMPEAPASSTAVRAVRVSFSGPLPPPRLLAQYNDAVADRAERIVKLTENQALHRQVLEVRAQIFTFVLALIGLLGGIGLIALGSSIEGLVALVAAIGSLGGVFVVRALLVHRGEKALIDG